MLKQPPTNNLTLLVLSRRSPKELAAWLKHIQITNQVIVYAPAADIEDFSQVRNSLQLRAQTDWVLWLDDDEELPLETQQAVAEICQKNSPDIQAVSFPRFDIFWGEPVTHGEVGGVKLTRLCRRTAGIWHRPVHEFMQIQGQTFGVSHPIWHRSHDSIADFFTSVSRYAAIEGQSRASVSQNKNVIFTKLMILFQLLFFPPAKFLYSFGWLQGWRDGLPGLVYSTLMSFHSLMVRFYWYFSLNHHDLYPQT